MTILTATESRRLRESHGNEDPMFIAEAEAAMAAAIVEVVEVPAVVADGYPPCTEFYVYQGDRLVRVCPSRGMADEVASGL